MMEPTVIVGLLSLAGTLFGSIAGIMTANKLTTYRINELEKKVDKHNTVMDRVTILEQSDKTQWIRIDEIRDDLERIKDDGK